MNENLFAYQTQGVEWLFNKKVALLADEMGLGKSAQTIVAADKIKAKRILVICPAIARLNWHREFLKFSSGQTPRNFIVVSSMPISFTSEDSVIISYDLASRLPSKFLGGFDLVILDEIHYAKSVDAKRTRAIYGKGGIIHGQKPTTKIWAISGTPAPNNASELWTLLYTFGVTRLSYDDFCERFCNVTQKTFGPKIQKILTGTKRERIPELRELLTRVMLRRTKEQVGAMLPKVMFQDVVVEPGQVDLASESSFVQYVFPNNCIAELEAKLKNEIAQVNQAINTRDIEVLKGLAKSVSTLRRYIGIQKVEQTAELIANELRAGLYDKVVIFAIHRDVIEGLRVRLKDFNPLTLYGGTRFDSANKHIDKFQTLGKYKVFIGNITACGIAINLTAAHQVVMVEQEWTPAANAQAIARCHRHGQTKPVSVRMVALANSLDEKITQILKKKTSELTEIFDEPKTVETFEDLL